MRSTREKPWRVTFGTGNGAYAITVTATDSVNALCAAVRVASHSEGIPLVSLINWIQFGEVRVKAIGVKCR
jgi:hypothetical protein